MNEPSTTPSEVLSMIAIVAILLWVRIVTGEPMLDIITDALPPLFERS